MTLQINGTDVADAIQLVWLVSTIFATVIIGMIIYLMVRPSRSARQAPPPPAEIDEATAAEMLRIMDRMEARLEVLERAVSTEAPRRLGPCETESFSEPAATMRPRSRTRQDSEIQGRKI
jgi:hypothetical protein